LQIDRFRRMTALALISIMLLTCTGCWDRKELNDLNVVTLLGFDLVTENGNPQVLLTALVLKTSSTGTPGMAGMVGGGAPSTLCQVASVQGETVSDALRNFYMRSPRQLYLGHVLGIVIGEEMARQGIQQVIDFADRDKDIRYRAMVVVCDGTALDALQAQPEYETLASTELIKEIEHDTPFVSKSVPANLFQVIYGLMTPGMDVAMPRMHLFTPPEKGSGIRKGPPSGTVKIEQQNGEGNEAGKDGETTENTGVGQTANPEEKTFSVDGSAIFREDKMVGWLNEDESMGVLFITGNAHEAVIPFAFRSPEKNASFVIRHVKSKVKPVITRDGITFEVSIKGDGDLSEDKNAAIDVMKESDIKAAEQLIDQEVQDYCQETVAKCQSLHSDPFGFGDLIHQTNPTVWKQIKDQWRDYYSTVKVQVKVDYVIEQTGVTNEAVETR
jgi:spore germination protein KC